jgi:hypothetical protein
VLTGIGTCNIPIICFPDSITGPSVKRCFSSTSFLRLLATKVCFSIRVALILTAEFPLLFTSNETGIDSPKSQVQLCSKTLKTIQFYAQNRFFPLHTTTKTTFRNTDINTKRASLNETTAISMRFLEH